MKYYDKLIFEISKDGRTGYSLPENRYPAHAEVPGNLSRETAPGLPQVSEPDVVRHYTNLSQMNFGVDTGFYPLGSCTMKYNPKINEEVASLPGFAGLHPLVHAGLAKGALKVYQEMGKALSAITGMYAFTFDPCAGAHGELTGLMLMRQYHMNRGDYGRTKVIVPDSAHGTNPASAAVCGLQVVEVKSLENGRIDVEALKGLLDSSVAGIMMTNPNTLGLFETEIKTIAKLVHEAGGLLYYDGANMNAIMGRVRPGDMGFDCIHLNLHKTFGTPHGGGGPGSGPVGCKKILQEFLPYPVVDKKEDGYYYKKPQYSMGQVRSFGGNFLVVMKALAYMKSLGGEGMKEASSNAVLNANYLMHKLEGVYDVAYPGICMHEFVLCLQRMKDETGVSAMDIAKGSLDFGIHPPTMYFPLIVHEALMLEPTETESRESLDAAAEVFLKLAEMAKEDPQYLHEAPHRCAIRRPNEVDAARKPVLKYEWNHD